MPGPNYGVKMEPGVFNDAYHFPKSVKCQDQIKLSKTAIRFNNFSAFHQVSMTIKIQFTPEILIHRFLLHSLARPVHTPSNKNDFFCLTVSQSWVPLSAPLGREHCSGGCIAWYTIKKVTTYYPQYEKPSLYIIPTVFNCDFMITVATHYLAFDNSERLQFKDNIMNFLHNSGCQWGHDIKFPIKNHS